MFRVSGDFRKNFSKNLQCLFVILIVLSDYLCVIACFESLSLIFKSMDYGDLNDMLL